MNDETAVYSLPRTDLDGQFSGNSFGQKKAEAHLWHIVMLAQSLQLGVILGHPIFMALRRRLSRSLFSLHHRDISCVASEVE